MENSGKIRRVKGDPDTLRISIMFLICTVLYYLPAMVGAGGGITAENTLNNLHNFFGLDFYALIFFIPVVYAAYSAGVIKAVFIAFASMLVFLPYSLFITNQPGAFFRPTAFVLILSAVGAVVAMLQRGDEQHRRAMDELKCLYDIGKAVETAPSVEGFLASIISIISRRLNRHGEIEVGITLRGKTYFEPGTGKTKRRIKENIIIAGEVAGSLEVGYPAAYSWDKQSDHFIKTLAERIGGAVHGIELEQSLEKHYAHLEEMVDNRKRELEQAQEKVIHSERLAAVGELASGVGQELRNPLCVIDNCVCAINAGLKGRSTPEVEDALRLLDLQVDISNKIIDALLDFTEIKSPSCSRVDLNCTVQDRVSWALIPEKITIRFTLANESPQLNVDAGQIGRAFTGIINYAVQSISNFGELRVSTGSDGAFGWVKFTDTGPGISQEDMDKIFEPLFTAGSKGIALGLAVSKRLVEQNGGAIEVESLAGKGTTFSIRLPIIQKEVLQYGTAGQYPGRG